MLLEAPWETSIVLEHKSVVWPPKHLSDHSKEHHLFERICDLLRNIFKDSVYCFPVAAWLLSLDPGTDKLCCYANG